MESTIVKLLIMGFCISLLCFGWVVVLARHLARKVSRDPRSVLLRCKVRLKGVRRELDRIPATHEIYGLYSEIENAERTIESTEARFRHSAAGK